MLFDFHTHLFPDQLAPKALPKLAATFGANPFTDGTVSGTRAAFQQWGVTGATVMHIAVKPGQQETVNNFAASIQGDGLYSFGSVHPKDPHAVEEIRRVASLGLHGLKFHPDYQGVPADDACMDPLLEEAEKLGLPVLFHTGPDPIDPQHPLSRSERIAHLLERFPNLTIIAAHMGGLNAPEEAEAFLLGKNLYIDTAMAHTFLTPEQFERMVRLHGIDRVLFGSDCPWSRSNDGVAFIEQTSLSTEEKEAIYWKNAYRLLKIK